MEDDRVPPRLMPAVRDVVHQLAIGNYAGLIADGRAAQWPLDILAGIVAEIAHVEGAPLTDLPDDYFETTDRGAFQYNDGSGWAVDVRMWTAHSPSAYTLNLEVDTTAEEPIVEIAELHIM